VNYKSLYRKYRPLSFDDVVEQSYIVRILRSQVISGKLAHAYLFTGTRGTGKTTIARIFAKAINCLDPQNGNPCGKCAACLALKEGSSDLFELDAASNNGVDNVRALVDSVQYLPMQTKYKVYIIDEVHMFSNSAFNALLKTIEEPPEYCIFILATTEPQKIPDTILSRCIKLDFRLVSTQGCFDLIKSIFDKENVKYTDDAIMAIAEAGQGSVRDSLSIAETCIGAMQDVLNYDTVTEVLGANSPEFILELVKNIVSGDLSGALSLINYSATVGKNIAVLARDITKYLRDLLILKADIKAREYIALPQNVLDKANQTAQSFSYQEILNCLELLSGTDSLMRYSSTPRYVLETAIAKCVSTTSQDINEHTARINKIERQLQEGVTVTKYVNEVRLVSQVQNVSGETSQMTAVSDLPFDTAVDVSSLPFESSVESSSLPFDIDSSTQNVEQEIPQKQEDKKETDKLSFKPSYKSMNKAKSIDFKGFLVRRLNENDRKIVLAIITADDVRINVYQKKAEIVVQSELDKKMLSDSEEYLKELTNEYFNENFPLEIVVNDNKQTKTSEDFQNLFDKSKIKINR